MAVKTPNHSSILRLSMVPNILKLTTLSTLRELIKNMILGQLGVT